VEISRVTRTAEGWTVAVKGGPNVVAERLLVAAGRKPCFDGHDLEAAGVRLDDKGRPQLTETLRTTAPHIWAGGDATGELLFTHVGGYEAGLIAADILGDPRPRDYRVVPKVTYCEPEVASVGLTEEARSRRRPRGGHRAGPHGGRDPCVPRGRAVRPGSSWWRTRTAASSWAATSWASTPAS